MLSTCCPFPSSAIARIITTMRSACLLLAAAMLLGGCAKYEFDLVSPPDLRRHIAGKVDTVAKAEPLEYRMRTVDNRLVIRVFNQSDDNIQLIGERSSVVDPNGQSHPLRGGPIAPHSFLKLIIPPPRPQVYNSGPTFGVGVGVGVSNRRYRHSPHYHYHDPGGAQYHNRYHEPAYLSVHDESDSYYWDWKGEGEARLTLVFQRGDKEFRQEFAFRRIKV